MATTKVNNEYDVIEEYLREPDIHEERRAGLVGAGLSLFVSLIATLLHAINAYLAFWTDTSFFLCVVIHLVLSVVVIFFASVLKGLGRDTRFMLLLGISTLVTGVFGAAGTLFTIVMHFWHMRLSQTFSEWFASIFPSSYQSRSQEVYDDIMFGRDENPLDYNVMPFSDVMTIGSEKQKREALGRMTQRFSPSFAPAFKKALNDDSNSIRVQAATSVAKIENQFMERLMRISEAVDLYPNDAKVKLVQAEHYDDYAFTGILDAERERINRRRALKHYQEYLELQPNDLAVRVKVGRLMLREKRSAEAADWFADSIERGYSSDSMMVWYLEALYASGRYSELRANAVKLAPRLSSYDDMRPALLNAIRMWAGVPEEHNMENVA